MIMCNLLRQVFIQIYISQKNLLLIKKNALINIKLKESQCRETVINQTFNKIKSSIMQK